jgi:hypothetical protein
VRPVGILGENCLLLTKSGIASGKSQKNRYNDLMSKVSHNGSGMLKN